MLCINHYIIFLMICLLIISLFIHFRYTISINLMFSLKQKKRITKHNNQTPTKNDSNQQLMKNEGYKQKPQSKKITKTVFEDPFNYQVQLLPHDEANQVQTLLSQYLTKLRETLPYKPPPQKIERVIKFQKDKNIKQKLCPLNSPQITIGIKKTKQILYNNHKKINQTPQYKVPYFTIIFYSEKYSDSQNRKHQLLVELLCLLKILNTPYLLLRDNPQINRLLGVRTVGSLCLMNEQFANTLLKYIGKSLIDIPWVIQLGNILTTQNEKQITSQ